MAGVNVKMGVSGVGEFKQGMKDAQESVKALNEALKLNESQMKLNGESELYMQNKIAILNDKIKAQEEVVRNAQGALDAMTKNGADPASAAYQKMQAAVYRASTNLFDMKSELKDVESGASGAGSEAENMNSKLKDIGEGVSWENLTTGIDSIISKLESGARAAINLGKKITSSAMDSTKWADDILTRSQQYGIDAETLQKMENAADYIDTDVDKILDARSRLYNGIGSGTKGTMDALGLLGITDTSDPAQVFWDAGEALMKMSDAAKKEATAQDLFGKSWKELVPLFTAGQKGYNEALEKTSVLTNEQVEALGKADDSFKSIQQEWERMKNSFWADNADKITDLMQWLIDNQGAVVAALTAIAGGFGALKLGSFALNLQQTISGFQKLGLLKGAKGAVNTAETAGKAITDAAGSATGGGGGWANAIDFDTIAGEGALMLIPAAYAWAIDRRRNHAEQVRGTDENLAARVSGVESALTEYILANREYENLDFGSMDWDAVEAQAELLEQRIQEARQKLEKSEGGLEALQAYSDWRQEHSLGNMDWELPDSLASMTEATSTLTEQLDGVQKSADAMTDAANNMQQLPALIESAVARGMSGVTITINQGAIDTIGRRNSGTFFDRVAALVKP